MTSDNLSNRCIRHRCLAELLPALENNSSPAILAPGREILSASRLCRQIQETVSWLNEHGMGRNDRIGVVLPSGPEMAAVFLSVAAGCTFVPISPACRKRELAVLASAANVRALMMPEGADSTASDVADVARERGIPLVGVEFLTQEAAGLFRLHWKAGGSTSSCLPGPAGPDDTAMVLTTSGTTSRPKIVPVGQDIMMATAHAVVETLGLKPEDRCLHLMPMHHAAGLISPVLASVAAGGSALCTPGFPGDHFAAWLDTYRPTWYSAVPSIHQAVIETAAAAAGDLRRTSLRFVRSTTSPLFEPLFEGLEKTFDRPIVQSYGMTEAFPISSSPLSPYRRNPRSVGLPVAEVSVVDDCGKAVAMGDPGEIVVRGPLVFRGYENDPEANEAAFSDGWFRTGDLGYLDAGGCLYVSGRVKDVINRGGQKVSPQEVEAVLMAHPAVRDAAAFGVPHSRLGETVAAAVVVTPQEDAFETSVRHHLSDQLASFKVPQQIIVVDRIPRGITGKFSRKEIADSLGHLLNPAFDPPATAVEIRLAGIWKDVLDVPEVGRSDNFFYLGGDSLMTIGLFSQIENVFGVSIPNAVIYQSSTVEQLAAVIEEHLAGKSRSRFIALRPAGSLPPLICIPPVTGEVLVYHHFMKYLDPEQPVYGLETADGVLGMPMEETAARHISEIRQSMPKGPFLLLGFSSGGMLAFEMARQLKEMGLPLSFLGVLDTSCLGRARGKINVSPLTRLAWFVRNLPFWTYYYFPFWLRHYGKIAAEKMKRHPAVAESTVAPPPPAQIDHQTVIRWLDEYAPQPLAVTLTFYRAQAQGLFLSYPDMGWGCFAERVNIRPILGTHESIMKEPHVKRLAEQISRDLKEAAADINPTLPPLARER